ncbi:MAG: triosephosphate isomerase [Gammaproteobacteria bacterium]|jgi:triosephosphate isomerase|nr:triosephosphate isomerase [Gammaproteobacteria bacterium]MEA3141920.1 triosephosphate isomerase [Gammaproteobacteria bacterium]
MRRPMVAGNWKMHGSQASNQALLAELERSIRPDWPIDIVVFPPYVYLADAVRVLEDGRIMVGAQDVCAESGGAFTGQVSAAMLKDVGSTYVIVGHSERRRWYHEDDTLVARKFAAALAGGLKPVLCVGETLEEREAKQTEAVVGRQVEAVIAMLGIGGFAEDAVLAYEPVWAIGTGRTATPEQAQAVHAFLRSRIGAHDAKIAGQLRILYGGSVKAGNAAELFAMPDVDGGLVGGASLSADEFRQICAAAAARQ